MEEAEQDPIHTTSFGSSDVSEDSETYRTHANRTIKQKAMFADASEMKANLHAQLSKPEYNVAMYYHKHGRAQRIARSAWFEQLTLSVIAFNALWIFIDTDYNPSPLLANAPIGFQIVEQLFCFYFAWEWLVRFLAFKKKLNGLRDAWFVFDSIMTLLFVVDSWVMYLVTIAGGMPGGGLGDASILRIFRLLRLTRMGRMARMLKAMPELLILLKAMGAAMRAVGMILSVQFVLLYIFGIAFKQLCSDMEQAICSDYFSSVPKAAHTLLINGVLMDSVGNIVYPLEQYSVVLMFLFYIFLMLSALSVMNMLIGLFCDVVTTTATVEKEALSILYVKERLQEIMLQAGIKKHVHHDSTISKEEFKQILANRQATQVLSAVGIDAVSLIDFAEFIFKADDPTLEHDEGQENMISFAHFVEVMLELRGNNNAAVKDVVNLRKFVQSKFLGLEGKIDAIASSSRRSSRVGLGLETGCPGEPLSAGSSRRPSKSRTVNLSAMKFTPDLVPEYNPQVSQSDTDGLLSLSERVQTIDTDLGKAVERLALEHRNTVATLRRDNERLQTELELIRSIGKYKTYLGTKGETYQQSDFASPTLDKLDSLQQAVTAEASLTTFDNRSSDRGHDACSGSSDLSHEPSNHLGEYTHKCDRELDDSPTHPLNRGRCNDAKGNFAGSSLFCCPPSMPAERPASVTL